MRPVLLVDDDASIRRSVPDLLRTVGLECETYRDGGAFLADADPGAGGPVLLDMRMPGLSGQQVLEALCERPDAPPVVMMSGFGEIEDAVRAMRSGAFDFLEKPIRPSRLLETVQRAVQVQEDRCRRLTQGARVHRRLESLSPREREVLKYIVDGYANKQIAMAMGLSQRTIEFHRNHVMTKMKAGSVAELVRMVVVCPAVKRVCGVDDGAVCGAGEDRCEGGDCRGALAG